MMSLEENFSLALMNRGFDLSETQNNEALTSVTSGTTSLNDNPQLLQQVCDDVAKATGSFWTFAEFQSLQNTSPTKPTAPQVDDPIFNPSSHTYTTDLERQVAQTYRFQQAQNEYEKDLQSHQKLLVQIRTLRAAGRFGVRGYLDYVLSTLESKQADFAQDFFFTSRQITFNEASRRLHTFITGGTGTGKSEAIKGLVRQYLSRKAQPTLVNLDPHGDLALDIARFKENAGSDRLVYVRPGHFKDKHISFNPFELKSVDEITLNRAQVQFQGALEQIINETLTRPQKALLTPCLGVLLHRPESTFIDLVRFMDDNRNRDLVNYGQRHLPNPQDRDFFKHQFFSRNFESTKEALRYRLGEIIRDPTVRDFLCQPSTFDLPNCLESGKLIVFQFNPDYHTQDAIRTTGQLLNAFITNYAMSRPKSKRRPIHVFADECQYFVSPKIEEILGETRKFGLFLTLATQRTEQVGSSLLDAILGNVGCYLIGRNKNRTAKKMSEEHPLKADDIRALKNLEFYQVQADRQPIKIKVDLIGDRFALPKRDWQKLKQQQAKKYYRKHDTSVRHANNTAPATRQPKFEIPDLSRHE